MLNNEIKELAKLINQGKVILFVGAGVSASVGMPTWKSMINRMAEDLGFEPDEFSSFSDYLQLASYYKAKVGSIDPILEWLKACAKEVQPSIEESKILSTIPKIGFRKIYTTNFDKILERAFYINKVRHKTIRGFADLNDISIGTQIIKFHGDFERKSQIVLTETDYFDRFDFNHPFDIKLRSDSIGNSILFIGYSFSDVNIRYLIYRLNKLWENHKVTNSLKSYIFLSECNPVKHVILKDYGIHPIFGEGKNFTQDLENFLGSLLEEVEAIKIQEKDVNRRGYGGF